MSRQKIILAGNGITAEILSGHIAADPAYDLVALTVDAEFVEQSRMASVPCVPLDEVTRTYGTVDHRIIMAVGYDDLNRTREKMFFRLKDMGYTIATYLHSSANIHDRNALGEGCIVLSGATIEPGACVCANSVVWSNAVIGHHAHVGDHCWIAAGTVVAGSARVGRNSFVGVNATLVNQKSVGAYNVIGAGALISRDTDDDSVHLARSAEPLRFSAQDYIKHFGL